MEKDQPGSKCLRNTCCCCCHRMSVAMAATSVPLLHLSFSCLVRPPLFSLLCFVLLSRRPSLPLQVEPGGNNEANESLHDRTHRPAAAKRPRRPVPATAASAVTAAAAFPHSTNNSTSAAVSASSNIRVALRRPTTGPVVAVRNPYTTTTSAGSTASPATASAGAGATVTGSNTAAVVPSVSRAPGVAVHNPYAAKTPATATRMVDHAAVGENRGCSDAAGGGRGGVVEGRVLACSEQGRSLVGLEPRGGQEYAEWKERVLASMENRVKKPNAPCSSAIANSDFSADASTGCTGHGGGSSVPNDVAGGGGATGGCVLEYCRD